MAGECLHVLIITADDPIYVPHFFEALIPALPATIKIVGVTALPTFNESIFLSAKRVLGLYGPIDFARLCLRYASARVSGHSVLRIMEKAGIARIETLSVNSGNYLRRVAELKPDVIVSVASPEIFKPDLLSLPRLGCFNVHSGQLPAYRGMMPVFWQLLAGETTAVVTVHEMVEAIDEGRVVDTVKVPLRQNDRLARAMIATKHAGAELLIDVLERLYHGHVSFRDTSPLDNCYRSFPRPEDARVFRERGHRML